MGLYIPGHHSTLDISCQEGWIICIEPCHMKLLLYEPHLIAKRPTILLNNMTNLVQFFCKLFIGHLSLIQSVHPHLCIAC